MAPEDAFPNGTFKTESKIQMRNLWETLYYESKPYKSFKNPYRLVAIIK